MSVVLPLPIVPVDPLVSVPVDPGRVVPVPGEVMPEPVVVVDRGDGGAPDVVAPVEPVPVVPELIEPVDPVPV